jgi:DNA-directed RNA polymerase specialized sigma24 family protein
MTMPSLGHSGGVALHHNTAERDAFVAAINVAAFTEAEREAVRAVFLECRSVRRAAVHLGVPHQTLQTRITTARWTLRAWLRRQAA